MNYWNKGKMIIGPHKRQVELNVNPSSSLDLDEDSSSGGDSSWLSDESSGMGWDSESEAEVYNIELLLQASKNHHLKR